MFSYYLEFWVSPCYENKESSFKRLQGKLRLQIHFCVLGELLLFYNSAIMRLVWGP